MNELEIWTCSRCKTERTWGQRTKLWNEYHQAGAVLNCQKCKGMTKHTFTGDHKAVSRVFQSEFDDRHSVRLSHRVQKPEPETPRVEHSIAWDELYATRRH